MNTEKMIRLEEDCANQRARIAELEAEAVRLQKERDGHVQLSEDLKMALRQPGLGSYVEWAKECRAAYDQLAEAKRAGPTADEVCTALINSCGDKTCGYKSECRCDRCLETTEAVRDLYAKQEETPVTIVKVTGGTFVDSSPTGTTLRIGKTCMKCRGQGRFMCSGISHDCEACGGSGMIEAKTDTPTGKGE